MSLMEKNRKKKDIAINGFMAKWYDKNTSKSRLDEMRRYADLVEANTNKSAAVLEVAPGPGYLAIDLAKRGFHVTGVEISHDFVEIEKRNAKEAGVAIDFKQGNASALPLPNDNFDFIICSAAFKNFKEPLQALHKMYRVLIPGGTALILDMNHAFTKEDLKEELARLDMKGLDRWFVKLSFKTFLKSGAYTAEGFRELILQTKFTKHKITKDGIGLNVWLYKFINNN